jgi:hypothetical protein
MSHDHWHGGVLGLKSLPPASQVAKCYMKELGSCVSPISGEHIVSEAVIRVLMADGDFSISGLPWLAPGEEKVLAPQNLKWPGCAKATQGDYHVVSSSSDSCRMGGRSIHCVKSVGLRSS